MDRKWTRSLGGRVLAAVAVTTGLLERLSHDEVAGVIAHELAHIKNHDTLIMTVTATGKTVTVRNEVGQGYSGLQINFADGVSWSQAQIEQMLLNLVSPVSLSRKSLPLRPTLQSRAR
ncbi:hypothetical protein B4Q13_15660 [Lacticaseibacillus rhamnosus]